MTAFRPSRVTAAIVLLAVLLAPAAQALQAQPPNTTYYAAIAYSKSTGRYGYSSGWLADINAKRDALKHCKADDAQVVLLVGNGYAALAKGDDESVYGFGYSEDSADAARRYALEECRKRTTNCYVAVCVHSWAG